MSLLAARQGRVLDRRSPNCNKNYPLFRDRFPGMKYVVKYILLFNVKLRLEPADERAQLPLV